MVALIRFICAFALTLAMNPQLAFAAPPKFQDNQFKRTDKEVATLWSSIPFFSLGDIGQYSKTMSQDRDQVRKMFFDDLVEALDKLASKGAMVESMVVPMANILLKFDQAHDQHKAKDVINIDKSLEAHFKGAFDSLFTAYDVRDDRRKIQISGGTESSLLQTYIRTASAKKSLGKAITQQEIDAQVAREMFEQIDYVAYGTFSSLGRGQFQVTLHITGNKNGVTRSFTSTGRLLEAVNGLALQLFDVFQKNTYADWQAPEQELEWIPQPANPGRSTGYSWEEAQNYCKSQGFRLPYSRELLAAEAGGAYKEGGIGTLAFAVPYSVADKRLSNSNYVFTKGNEMASGGPVQGASYSMTSRSAFWCVRGEASEEVKLVEEVWSLIRKFRTNKEIFRALHTVRYEIGDFGIDGEIYWGPRVEVLERMNSLEDALKFLRSKEINLKVKK